MGDRLDRFVKKPFVGKTLRLMRTPAEMAGLGDLQDFLERGYAAFRDMDGAGDFLEIIEERETELLNALFSGEAAPS